MRLSTAVAGSLSLVLIAHAARATGGAPAMGQKNNVTAQLAPVAAPQPVAPIDGAIDVTSAEPGTLLIDDAEYGSAPQLVEHLPAGPHRVTVRFESGGESTRTIAVRPGSVATVFVDLGGARKAFNARQGFHFAVGVEGVISYAPEERSHGVRPGFRGFARVTYGVAPALTLRADFAIGYLGGDYLNGSFDYGTACGATGSGYCLVDWGSLSATSVPILARFDAQVHFGSVYSMVFGGDAGVTVTSLDGSGTRTSYDSHSNATVTPLTISQVSAIPTVGFHMSFLTFNFGPERQFSLSVTQGLLAYVPTGRQDTTFTFEQTASFSYRF